MDLRPLDTLAQRVRFARKQRGLSQEQLAERSGLQQGDISKLETGRMQKTTGIARLARALQVSDAWLELHAGPDPEWATPGIGGGSLHEPDRIAYSASSRNKNRRLEVAEWVNAGSGGSLEPMTTSDLGFVDLPQDIEGLRAIRVRGDGLQPTVDDGRVLIVEPGGECVPDDWVLLTMQDGSRLCKKLLIVKQDSVVVSDLATQERRTIPRSEMKGMDPVTTVSHRWRPTGTPRGMSVFGDLDE